MRKGKGIPKTDITGRKFGMLTAVKFHDMGEHGSNWECVCDCGKTKVIRINHLTGHKTLSCGCLRRRMFDKWRIDKMGPTNPMWKGGKTRDKGYVKILTPFKDRFGKPKYVLEHRKVMSELLGRELKRSEAVHHKNGIKDDNRAENLELMTKYIHKGEIECPHCQKTFFVR